LFYPLNYGNNFGDQMSEADLNARGQSSKSRCTIHRISVISRLRQAPHLVCKEIADHRPDLLRMSLKREVARVEEMDARAGNVASERLGTPR
jgi:hypothetical protein